MSWPENRGQSDCKNKASAHCDLFRARSDGKFVESRAGEAYDARA